VTLADPSGLEAVAVLPDNIFYAEPVAPGDAATLVWSAADVHTLTGA
jgi:putative spermidine/putrescine transport system ATP-binding protein